MFDGHPQAHIVDVADAVYGIALVQLVQLCAMLSNVLCFAQPVSKCSA